MKQHRDFFQLLNGLFSHLLIYHLSIYLSIYLFIYLFIYSLWTICIFFSGGIIQYNTTREHEKFSLALQNWRICAFQDKESRKLTFEYRVRTFTRESILLSYSFLRILKFVLNKRLNKCITHLVLFQLRKSP